MGKLRVDVWSDIACPWCWVGRRHLEAAVAQFPHEVEVVWRAFELDPAAPKALPESTDLVQKLADKYGTDRQGAQSMIDRMDRVGTEAGLDFRFDRVKPTNTFDAHRLLHWAAKFGKQDALKERLMSAYMHEGLSVSDHAVLADLADAVGLPADETAALLSSDQHAQDVRDDERMAAQLGVTGVPFFAIDERFAVPGAQPAELLLAALTRAYEQRPADEAEADAAASCGPDGCSVPAR